MSSSLGGIGNSRGAAWDLIVTQRNTRILDASAISPQFHAYRAPANGEPGNEADAGAREPGTKQIYDKLPASTQLFYF